MTEPLSQDIVQESVMAYLERMRSTGQLDVSPSNRCRVCREPLVLGLVNKMLGRAFTPTDIMGTLAAYNRTLPKRRQISFASVYQHARNHFPIQEPAVAVWRELAERRYAEAGKDLATGIGTMVNHLSFLETVMIRGYEQLSDPTVPISVDQGMRAAVRLSDIQRKDEGLMERAQLLSRMNSVIELVRKFVPQEQWPALQAALSGEEVTREAIEAVMDTPKVRMVDIQDEADEEEEQR